MKYRHFHWAVCTFLYSTLTILHNEWTQYPIVGNYVFYLQLWIAANHRESPVHSHIHTYAMNNYINWSWTYRPDSHILTPFSLLIPLPKSKTSASNSQHRPLDINAATTNYARGKTKMAAWFVSNCWDSNGRTGYAKELSKWVGFLSYLNRWLFRVS